MTTKPQVGDAKKPHKIKVLIVDDIPEARENLKKLLAFEPDIEVVGTASTGREGLEQAKELLPNIILMDINMPDMDGITATKELRKAVPSANVVMMSVQGEAEYIRRAMAAGARDFLIKPPPAEELYATVRNVYESYKDVADIVSQQVVTTSKGDSSKLDRQRGRQTHVIVVYSPQGGVGKTFVAANLASGLMKEGTKVLLIDADLQFGDVGIFLNLQGQRSLADLAAAADDLDVDLVENVLVTHDSGLKVLLSPADTETAESISADKVGLLVTNLRGMFDFIVVDLSSELNPVANALLHIAERILLVSSQTLSSVKRTLDIIRLMGEAGFPEEKILITLNKVVPDLEKAKLVVPLQTIEQKAKRKPLSLIPQDERRVLAALRTGLPVVAKDQTQSPAKELLMLADAVRANLLPPEEAEGQATQKADASKSKLGRLFSG